MLKWNASAQAAVNTKRIIKPQLLLSDELIRQRQERRAENLHNSKSNIQHSESESKYYQIFYINITDQ